MDNSNESNNLRLLLVLITTLLEILLINGCCKTENDLVTTSDSGIIKSCIYFKIDDIERVDVGLITKFSDEYNLIEINDSELFDYIKEIIKNILEEESISRGNDKYYIAEDECNYQDDFLEATRYEQKIMSSKDLDSLLSELEGFEMKVLLQNIKSSEKLELTYFLEVFKK